MGTSKTSLAYIFSICLLCQSLVTPVMSAPPPENQIQFEHRQSPLSPSQFALAATRFIVMLPFLPLMMAVPGVTAVVMPLFMALQDRLTTMIPNMGGNNNNNNNNNNNGSPQGGVVTNLISAFGGGSGGNIVGSGSTTTTNVARPSAMANILKALGIRRPGNSNQNQNQQESETASAESAPEAASEIPTYFRFRRSLMKVPSKDLNEGMSQVLDFLAKTVDVIDSNQSNDGPYTSSESATDGTTSINEGIREVFDFLYTSGLGFNNPNGSFTDSKNGKETANSTLALTEGFKEVFDFLQHMNISLNDDSDEEHEEQESSKNSDAVKVSPHPRSRRAILKLPTKALNEGFREVFSFLHKTDDVLNQLTSGQPDCRRQAVCRVHHSFDPSIGSLLGNIIQALRLESKVEKLDVSETARSILKEVIRAANTGLVRKDCSSVYSKCSIAVRTRTL